MSTNLRRSLLEAASAAAEYPNGWVYVVDKGYPSVDQAPVTAIVGAWKVDAEGRLTGEFFRNPNYLGNRTSS